MGDREQGSDEVGAGEGRAGEVDRRTVLRRAAGVAAGAAVAVGFGPLLAACQDTGSSTGSTVAPTGATGTTGAPPPWDQLAERLRGDLVLPSASDYDDVRVLFNPRFDELRPAAVARCRTPEDVQAALQFADAYGVPIKARSGGHTYAGYSSADGCLQLDLRGLNTVVLGRDGTTATVGPGTLLVDTYNTLFQAGRCVPGGSCPTVAVAGLVLGGGVGFLGRRFGTLSDNLESIAMVTVDGRMVTADAGSDPDLLWASQGGGGGNFGVVTALRLRTHPVGDWSTFQMSWNWEQTPQVAAAWFDWLDGLPDEVWSMLSFSTQDPSKGPTPVCEVKGQVTAPAARARQLLDPLIAAVGGPPVSNTTVDQTWLSSAEMWAGCTDLSIAECRTRQDGPAGTLPRQSYKAKSDYLAAGLPPEAVEAIIDAVGARQSDPALTGSGADFSPGGIEFDSYGGALNRPAPTDTAFVHRDQVAHGQYLAFWANDATPDVVDANQVWIAALADRLGPFTSGQAYQNYIDPDRSDWLRAYYGQNLEKLVQVKKTWDPDGRLDFAQGIPRSL